MAQFHPGPESEVWKLSHHAQHCGEEDSLVWVQFCSLSEKAETSPSSEVVVVQRMVAKKWSLEAKRLDRELHDECEHDFIEYKHDDIHRTHWIWDRLLHNSWETSSVLHNLALETISGGFHSNSFTGSCSLIFVCCFWCHLHACLSLY